MGQGWSAGANSSSGNIGWRCHDWHRRFSLLRAVQPVRNWDICGRLDRLRLIVGLGALCRKILDIMDMCFSSNSGTLSFTHDPDPGHPPGSLCDHRGNLELPDADHSYHSNISPPRTDHTARGRQILERLLTLARLKDPADKAANLISKHGSLAAVLAIESDAPINELLLLIRQAIAESLRSAMDDKQPITGLQDVIDYLYSTLAYAPVEKVHAIFLDARNCFLCDELISRGTLCEAPIYPREILKRALALDASGLILAHNHPSGDPTPSDRDIQITGRLRKTAHEIGITLHDHLVIGRNGWTGIIAGGYL